MQRLESRSHRQRDEIANLLGNLVDNRASDNGPAKAAVTESEGGADDEAIEEVVHPVADHDRAHDTRLLGRLTS